MSGYRDRFEKEINRIGVSHIAQTLGVARNTVYNWMANGNVPMNQMLALEGLGVDIVYVLKGVRMPLVAESGRAGYASELVSDDEAALLDEYRHSAPEMQAAAHRVLNPGESDYASRIQVRSSERAESRLKTKDRIEIRSGEKAEKKFKPPKIKDGKE